MPTSLHPSASEPAASTAAASVIDGRAADATHAEQRRVWHVHAAVFAVTMLAIGAVNLMTNLAAGITGEWSAWWSIWALIGWSLGLAIHGLVVRLARPEPFAASAADRTVDECAAGQR